MTADSSRAYDPREALWGLGAAITGGVASGYPGLPSKATATDGANGRLRRVGA
jgi:hypothetical protein